MLQNVKLSPLYFNTLGVIKSEVLKKRLGKWMHNRILQPVKFVMSGFFFTVLTSEYISHSLTFRLVPINEDQAIGRTTVYTHSKNYPYIVVLDNMTQGTKESV